MAKVYLCAQFSEQALMKHWKEVLESYGHIITSRWLDVTEIPMTAEVSDDRFTAASVDLDDIDKADVIMSKTLSRGIMFTGGGRHIEYGYALAKGKKLINVGGEESVFHSMAITVATIHEAIKYI